MAIPVSNEGFQPRAHHAPTTPWRRLLFTLRLTADLQTNTIYRHLRHYLPGATGKLVDIGCGNSPFRHLVDPQKVSYQGIDVERAASFGYRNPDTVYYDGRTIPFADATFDVALCTEVLEHVPQAAPFVSELHRVIKPGGLAIVTLPWSARFHYQPYDYHRYTPTMLREIFASFGECTVLPRGTDFSSIASKVVVAYIRNLTSLRASSPAGIALILPRLVGAVLAVPFLATALVLGHAGIIFGLGSTDDPLGYTIILRK